MVAVNEFFDHLDERADPRLLGKMAGSLRFDLVADGRVEHWRVESDGSHVTVARRALAADAVVTVDRSLFADIVSGRANAMAATLRGALSVEGDLGLVMSFQRLFSGPDDARHQRRAREPEPGGAEPPATKLPSARAGRRRSHPAPESSATERSGSSVGPAMSFEDLGPARRSVSTDGPRSRRRSEGGGS